ncbi:transmembrane 6 superfamily member 1-like isoform X2 [Mizuhopecten yessoensis]|uniref:transmembrane 6 superfamily member 1-like isoform X1 n=1 Tax=Mizuhopecten yessoensis TaxID=6573 RepID=UPI000B45CC27|nr:transmembrane 6 superfamily member 1-like isoform X1 [Mizuhopecten yessoensis]XP_021351705.1 transmembrane 6 superfamily member 1-like isoform X2 [Mizuhopecten yessoensis]
MAWSGVVVICLTSLIGLPLTYSVNLFKDNVSNPLIILGIGGVALILVALLPYLYTRNTDIPKRDPYFYAWSLFAFACVVDLIIALENDRIIHSFMAFYLLEGEPYLKTTHGTFINYWDAVVHFSLYIYILKQDSYNERYRKAGLYWVGSITNSLLIILPAGLIGEYGVRWPILLNMPYLCIPVWMGYKFLTNAPQHQTQYKSDSDQRGSQPIQQRPVDLMFIVVFTAAIGVHVLRASAVLGSPAELAKNYLQQYEPYLTDGVAFPKVQMLLYLFYFVPYYVLVIFDLLYPSGQSWVVDWSLIMAGASGEGQFSFIGASIHPYTPAASQLPQGNNLLFWVINGALFIVPHLYAYRCVTMPTKSEVSTVHNGRAVLELSDSQDKELMYDKRDSSADITESRKYNLRNRRNQ